MQIKSRHITYNNINRTMREEGYIMLYSCYNIFNVIHSIENKTACRCRQIIKTMLFFDIIVQYNFLKCAFVIH